MTATAEELQGWAIVTEKLLRDAALLTLCEIDEPCARLSVVQSYTSALAATTRDWLCGVVQQQQQQQQPQQLAHHTSSEHAVQAGSVAAPGSDHACQTDRSAEPRSRHDAGVGSEDGAACTPGADTAALVTGLQHEMDETRVVQRRVVDILRDACRALGRADIASDASEEGAAGTAAQARRVEWWAEELCRRMTSAWPHTSAKLAADDAGEPGRLPSSPATPLPAVHDSHDDGEAARAAEMPDITPASPRSSLREQTPSVEYDALGSPGGASQTALYQRILPLPPVSRITASLLRVQAQIRQLREEPSQPRTTTTSATAGSSASVLHRGAWPHVLRSPGPTYAARQTSMAADCSRDMVYTPRTTTTTASLTPRLPLRATPRLVRSLYPQHRPNGGAATSDATPVRPGGTSAGPALAHCDEAELRAMRNGKQPHDLAATAPPKVSAAEAKDSSGADTVDASPAAVHAAEMQDEGHEGEEEASGSEPAPSRRLAAALQAADAWQQRMRQLQEELRDLRGGLHTRS